MIVPSGSPDSYCRLCLSETNVEALLVAADGGFPQQQPNQALVDLIRRHVAIGLSAPADSPCGICSTCRMMLEEFERFRERCLRCDYALTGVDRQRGQVLPFECSQCPSKFWYKSEFEKHWKSFHDLYYHCDVCEAAFSTQSMLNGHSKFHAEGQQNGEVESFNCSYCPRMFSNETQLRFHVQLLHEPPLKSTNEYVPPVRKRKTMDNPKAKASVEAAAQPPEPAPAPMVSINIINPSGESDSITKPYECQTCRVRFHFIGSLTRHINDKHSHSKPKGGTPFRRKKKTAPMPVAPVQVEEPILVVDEPDPLPVLVPIPSLVVSRPDPVITIPSLGISIPVPVASSFADPVIPDTSAELVPTVYGHFSVAPDEPTLIPDLESNPKTELSEYMVFNEHEPDPTPIVYPCFVLLERLDENLIPPIPNAECPLGKYYHALQMQYTTATEDPIDDEFKKNYPSYSRKQYGKKFKCDICSVEMNSRLALYRHKQYKHSNTVFDCPYCSRQFPVKDGLDRHMPLHTNEYPHTCDECPIGFTRLGLLNKHKAKYHAPGAPPQKLHYCPYCSRAFNKLYLIKNHVALLHQDQYNVED